MIEQVTEVTPSGIEVRYTPEQEHEGKKVKRMYEVCRPPASRAACLASLSQDWMEVPSVTTVLGILAKGGLPKWGRRVGVAGTLELHRRGILREVQVPDGGMGQRVLAIPGGIGEGLVVAGVDQIVDSLAVFGLDTDDILKEAGHRGTAVHDGLEFWAKEGVIPDPEMFLPEQRGYVDGLNRFLADLAVGEPEVVGYEVMVGSVEHGFAGRYDLRVRTHKECELQKTHVRFKEKLPPGDYLCDLKTSSDVYLSYLRQLEGYEIGSVECGYAPTDERAVIHVSPKGTYKFVRSCAQPEDFLSVLEVWRSEESLNKRRAAK